jgi:nucleotide-binding universal stress UspA family protein
MKEASDILTGPTCPQSGISDAIAKSAGPFFQRVLVPVDFSVCTLETLRYARTLAEKSNVMVDVLHVVSPGLGGRQEPAMPGASLFRTMIGGTRLELKKLVGILWTNEVRPAVSIQVREGRAAEVILREAGITHAALIIMGMRRRSWMSGLLRRHTVKQVIQNSPCPVLVLRTGMAGSDYLKLNLALAFGKTGL